MIQPNFNNFIQVAGIIDQQEADMLIACGINYLGFPLRLPINTEDLTEEDASAIIKNLNPPHFGVLISYSSTADEANKLCSKLGCNIIQLHGPISTDELNKLRFLKPNLTIIKSLVIRENNEEQLKISLKVLESFVDAFITDTFDSVTGASGATGKIHDWEISKRLVQLSKKPVILAGGLNPDNVNKAILQVKPAGVDVHTGIENLNGRKDKQLVIKFLEEAQEAFKIIERK